jgi:hypothetical protein
VNYTWAWQVTPAGLAIHNAGQWLQQGRIVAQKQGQYRLELTQEGSALAQTQIVVLDAGQLQWQAQIASAALPARQVKTVHVVGDFNRWQIDSNWQLALHDDNSWRGRFSLDPGLYEYKIVIDSEIWRTDPHNSDSLADGWQGFNSLLRHRYDLLDKRRHIPPRNWQHCGLTQTAPGMEKTMALRSRASGGEKNHPLLGRCITLCGRASYRNGARQSARLPDSMTSNRCPPGRIRR